MENFASQVVEFNKVAGTSGDEFNVRKTGLYIGLVFEELNELIESLGEQREAFKVMSNFLHQWGTRFKEGDFDDNIQHINRVEALDAFVDIGVVALGGGHALGSDVVGAANHVMESNLSKSLIDENGNRYMLKDENGKVQKPETYWSPKLEQFLK